MTAHDWHLLAAAIALWAFVDGALVLMTRRFIRHARGRPASHPTERGN